MRDYWKATTHSLLNIYFNSRGVRYKGQGRMSWEHEKGFQIEALVGTEGEPGEVPSYRQIAGLLSIPNDENTGTVRMNLPGQQRAILHVYTDYFDRYLEPEKWVSMNTRRLILKEPNRFVTEANDNWWYSSALYSTIEELRLPDSVYTEIKLNDFTISQNASIGGLLYEDTDMIVRGRMLQKDRLEITWRLSRSRFTRQDCWGWADAVAYALSILSFHSIKLLSHEVNRGNWQRTDIRKYQEAEEVTLGGGWSYQIHREELIELSVFLATNYKIGLICRRMFEQIAEANRQKTRHATELSLATILEAALRTLYNRPFIPGNAGTINIREYMEKFRQQYLIDEWKDACDRAIDVQKRLRHRNAHPDWLETGGGYLSHERKEQSLKDMYFLTWFYRYMMLAISGNKKIKPRFDF